MYGRAIDTQEDPISHRRPGWVLRIAIKTHLPKQEEIQTKKTFTDIINKNHSKTIDLGDRARSETDLHKLNTNSQGNTTNFALGFRTKLPENSILVAEILGSHGRCGERDRSSERRCKEQKWSFAYKRKRDLERPPQGTIRSSNDSEPEIYICSTAIAENQQINTK